MSKRTGASKRLRSKVRDLGRALESQAAALTGGMGKAELKRVWYQKGYDQAMREVTEGNVENSNDSV